ncbi:MAG: HAD hydrolase-like protein [bacterium]
MVDSQEGIFNCVRYAMEKLEKPLADSTDLRWCVGPPLQKSFTQLTGGDAIQSARALAFYRERYTQKGIYEYKLYPDISEMLAALQPIFHLYLATSKPWVYAGQVLEHSGIKKFFSGIYGSELDGTRVEKTDLIRHLLDQENLEAAKTLMIGDRREDITGAAANHLPGWGAAWGFGSAEELTNAGAQRIFKSPRELMAALVPGKS